MIVNIYKITKTLFQRFRGNVTTLNFLKLYYTAVQQEMTSYTDNMQHIVVSWYIQVVECIIITNSLIHPT